MATAIANKALPTSAHPCDECAAGCCREVYVLPSGHDVYRIAEALRLPIAAFTFLRGRDRADGAFRIRLDGGRDPGVPHYRLELAKVDNIDDADGSGYARRCHFLRVEGPEVRCGIYEVRPADCAIYPTSRAGETILIGRRLPYCPPRSWSMALVDEPAQLALHRRRTGEQLIYERVVERWNEAMAASAASVSAGAFTESLAHSYRRLSRRAPALDAAAALRSETAARGALRALVDETLD